MLWIAFQLVVFWFIGMCLMTHWSATAEYKKAKSAGYPRSRWTWWSEIGAPSEEHPMGVWTTHFIGPDYPKAHRRFLRFTKAMAGAALLAVLAEIALAVLP